MVELIKLTKIAGVMHEADYVYSLSGAPGDCIDYLPMYPFIARVINLPC